MLKFFYDNFWYPVFGKILSKFVFLIEGKNNDNEKSIELYYVMVMTPSKGQKDRYVFDGEAPFGVNVSQVPPMGEATHFNHSISALSLIHI